MTKSPEYNKQISKISLCVYDDNLFLSMNRCSPHFLENLYDNDGIDQGDKLDKNTYL